MGTFWRRRAVLPLLQAFPVLLHAQAVPLAVPTMPQTQAPPPGNVLRIGAPRLDRPTLTVLGVQLPIEGDINLNSVVTVRYREVGRDTWREALPLFRVHPETVSGLNIEHQFSGSIFDLKPGTKYDIELHAVDPDGNVDQRLTLQTATRIVPADPVAPHESRVRNADELAAALQQARAGDVILLADGAYAGQFRIAAAGTAENPIVIRGASQEGAILDGQGCTGCNVLEVEGEGFVHIERLTIRNAERAIRFQTNGAQANVVRRVHVSNTTMGIGGSPDQKDYYICDNTLEGRLKWPLFYNADAGAHSDDDGIQAAGFGHVVCHNQISGYGDAMKTTQRGARAIDFYGNDIRYSYDNGVELDESAGNVRLFRNRFLNAFDSLSIQPIFGGPAYMFRNLVVNSVDEQMKFHGLGMPPQEPSGILVFHNTFVSPDFALKVDTPAMSHYFLIANNVFAGPRDSGLNTVVDWDAPFQTGVFDYNAYFPEGIFHFNVFKAPAKQFPTLSVLQGSGLETHGVTLSEPVFRNRFLLEKRARTMVLPVDLTLAANSPAVDRGVYLPNINDDFTGAAPDLGAIESGCPAPIYGPRPEGVDETSPPATCPSRSDTVDAPSSQPAMLLLARVSGGAPPRPVTSAPSSPHDIAERALQLAAAGNFAAGFSYFTGANFPQPKQDDFVREAYFELQLQSLLGIAASHQCAEADRGIANLGYEDKSLPFTFYGFGAFIRRLRVQYLIGTVELACGDGKSARRRFEKISKANADLTSTDYPFPYLALARLDPDAAREKARATLETVEGALALAKPYRPPLLLYHWGMLHLVMGHPGDASATFSEGARSSTGMVRYLNLNAQRSLSSPTF